MNQNAGRTSAAHRSLKQASRELVNNRRVEHKLDRAVRAFLRSGRVLPADLVLDCLQLPPQFLRRFPVIWHFCLTCGAVDAMARGWDLVKRTRVELDRCVSRHLTKVIREISFCLKDHGSNIPSSAKHVLDDMPLGRLSARTLVSLSFDDAILQPIRIRSANIAARMVTRTGSLTGLTRILELAGSEAIDLSHDAMRIRLCSLHTSMLGATADWCSVLGPPNVELPHLIGLMRPVLRKYYDAFRIAREKTREHLRALKDLGLVELFTDSAGRLMPSSVAGITDRGFAMAVWHFPDSEFARKYREIPWEEAVLQNALDGVCEELTKLAYDVMICWPEANLREYTIPLLQELMLDNLATPGFQRRVWSKLLNRQCIQDTSARLAIDVDGMRASLPSLLADVNPFVATRLASIHLQLDRLICLRRVSRIVVNGRDIGGERFWSSQTSLLRDPLKHESMSIRSSVLLLWTCRPFLDALDAAVDGSRPLTSRLVDSLWERLAYGLKYQCEDADWRDVLSRVAQRDREKLCLWLVDRIKLCLTKGELLLKHVLAEDLIEKEFFHRAQKLLRKRERGLSVLASL